MQFYKTKRTPYDKQKKKNRSILSSKQENTWEERKKAPEGK